MNIDAKASKIAVAMGVVLHQCFDRRARIVERGVADNAEVANSAFEKP
jgi:hypothetical protein